jgi:hypothetical protein
MPDARYGKHVSGLLVCAGVLIDGLGIPECRLVL